MDKLDQIKDILDNFDFKFVHLVMKSPFHAVYDDEGNIIRRTKWTLCTPDGLVVPTIEYLKTMAIDLLLDVSKKPDGYSITTGPFKVTNTKGILGLEFACASWDCSYLIDE